MTSSLRFAWFPALIAGWLAVAGAAEAATPGIIDNAGFFSTEAKDKADAIIRDIKSRHREDVVIETFPAVPQGKEELASNRGEERNRFFAEWARERARAQHV